MKYVKLFEKFLRYAKKEFGVIKIQKNEEVGILYHGTEYKNAISILKDKFINTGNMAYSMNKFKREPWFISGRFGYTDKIYGEFVYTSKEEPLNTFYGVGDCYIEFCINGDALIKKRIIYKSSNPKIEGYLHMVEGSIPLEFVYKIVCSNKLTKKQIENLKKYTNIEIEIKNTVK